MTSNTDMRPGSSKSPYQPPSRKVCLKIALCQSNNAKLYRSYEKLAPWNSKTRAGWKQLAEEAESCADYYQRQADAQPDD